MQDKQYDLAIQFLEKILDHYPNDAWAHNFLSDIYTSYLPNTEKYLTHAIQGINRSTLDQDSSEASISYLHLGNALVQTGFVEQAMPYIQQSMALDTNNVFSEVIFTYLQLVLENKPLDTKKSLLKILQKDSTNVFVLQEVAKICYHLRDYESSWKYYHRFLQIITSLNWEVYRSEYSKIAFVLQQLGKPQEAQKYQELYLEFIKKDQSIYSDLSYSAYYALSGKTDQGIKHLKAFSEKQNLQYWIVLFLEDDPIIEQLSNHPDYPNILKKINTQFWEQHHELEKKLNSLESFKNN